MFLTLGVQTGSLPTGSHVKIRHEINGKVEQRPYTPTRFNGDECELLLRVYPQGKITQYLYGLQVGDMVEMRGPTGMLRYESAGVFTNGSRKKWEGITNIICLAGGTGITPMLQVTNHVLQDEDDATQLNVLAFNTTEDDCMLEEELTDLASGSSGQLVFSFVVSNKGGGGGGGGAGGGPRQASMRTMDPTMLMELLGVTKVVLEAGTTVVCVCGPLGFVESAKVLLEGSGVLSSNVLVF